MQGSEEGGELAFSMSRGRVSSLDSTRRGPDLLHILCNKGDRRRLAQPGGVVLFNHSEADFAMKPGDYIVQMTIQMIVNCDTGGRRGGG
uniref:Deoxyuridine 5'-triphosphate nucleotidohydrolase n=1 Tax=Triticum urartu TaxID=4572 RepID=A0A8R7V695_TRIUA